MIRTLLFVFAASIPLTDVSRYFLGSGSVSEALLVLMLLASVVAAAWSRLRITAALTLLYAVLVFAVWSYILATFRDVDEASISGVVRQAEYFGAAFAVSQLADDSLRRRALVQGLLAGCGIALLLTWIHWLLGPSALLFHGWGPPWAAQYTEANFRVWGSFGNPLSLVTYLSTLLGIVSVFALRETRRRRQTVLIGFLLLIILGLIATGSRIAVLALSIPLVYSLASMSMRGFIRGTYIGFLTLLPLLFTDVAAVIVSRLGELGADSLSVVQRFLVFRSAISMMADRPFFGVGVNSFEEVYYPDYLEPGASLDPTTFTPENMFLLFGAELGIPAMFTFVLALAIIIWGGFRQRHIHGEEGDRRMSEAMALGVLCFTAASLVQTSSDAASRLLLFTLFGALIALQASENHNRLLARDRTSTYPQSHHHRMT